MEAPFYKQVIQAVLRELIKFKSLVAALFIVATFVVLLAGYLYPKQYVTTSLLYADVTNIITPLLKGRAVAVVSVISREQGSPVICSKSSSSINRPCSRVFVEAAIATARLTVVIV